MSACRLLLTGLVAAGLSACAPLSLTGNSPSVLANSTVGEEDVNALIPTSQPLIVGVYDFYDQTGQRVVLDDRATSEMSTAVPQGLSSMLVQELKALDEGRWFRVVEREGISKVLNERNIVLSTLEQGNQLQPLLLPGVIITGGAVSYDRKVYQRFTGAGFASVNARREIYSDEVSVALRAVSVQTGEVLEAIYVTKAILSQMNGLTGLDILNNSTLAVEAGQAQNEPVSLAVRGAIGAAVSELRRRGIARGWWAVTPRTTKPDTQYTSAGAAAPDDDVAEVSEPRKDVSDTSK